MSSAASMIGALQFTDGDNSDILLNSYLSLKKKSLLFHVNCLRRRLFIWRNQNEFKGGLP